MANCSFQCFVDIIEKTAGFVAKNGREFEIKIHENERHNPKFSFMSPNDPYHMYYQKRLEELVAAGMEAILKAISGGLQQKEVSTSEAQVPDNQTGQQAQPVKTIEPLDFLLEISEASALSLDVIKLTAQFAVKNGRHFLLLLSQKESRNPQFDFLKPHHHLHNVFQSLLRQYELASNPADGLLARVARLAKDCQSHLALVKQRAEFERAERERQHAEATAADQERAAFARIDWYDWVVADCITMTAEDEKMDLPAPLNPEILNSLPPSRRLELWLGRPVEEPVGDLAESATVAEVEEIPDEIRPHMNEVVMGAGLGTMPVKVRMDYVPRAEAATSTHGSSPAEPSQVCSICGASVPISQIKEHIRIELLDPRWREQRVAALSKQQESNVVQTGNEVSRNLAALARMRSDIFIAASSNVDKGNSGVVIQRGPTRPIWDGRMDSVAQIHRAANIMAKPFLQQEMAALQQSGDPSLNPGTGIGPRMLPFPQIPGYPYPPGQMPPMPPQFFYPPGQSYPPGQFHPPGQSYSPGQSYPPNPQ